MARPYFVAFAFAVLATVAPAQTLPQYLDSLKWDAASKGPLIAVVPGPKRPAANVQGLAAYARKLMVVGGVTVVAPTKMVVIDGSMKTPPNMYDGLPREAKVLYLLSTLTSSQLTKASGRGIGLADLNQDQQPVFLSLLPNPFKWEKGLVEESGIPDTKSRGALTDEQRLKVRLRIAKAISFQIGLADGSRGYTMHGTAEEYGLPGSTVWYRNTEADYDKHEAFGIQIRQEVDNQLKKSHLDYQAAQLQKPVELKPHETIQSLLAKVRAVTGLELYADMRVENLDVASYGQKAAASEVLQAIALGVTGTYRQVQYGYVLTSDLVGMGTRKLRLSLWQSDIQKEVWKRMTDWRVQILEAGMLSKIDYDEDGSLAPDADTRKLLDAFKPADGAESVETSTLSPNLRGFIDRVNRRYPTQQVRTDRLSMEASLRFGFVLPDGNRLHIENTSLGEAWAFQKPGPPRLPDDRFPKEPYAMAKAQATRAIAISLDNPAMVAETVETIRKIGFNEIWLHTTDLNVLSQVVEVAKASNIAVRFMIKPWLAGPREMNGQLDLTLLGYSNREMQALAARSTAFQETASNTAGASDLLLFPPKLPPDFNQSAARWIHLGELARTPGLAGAIVTDSRPRGYEPSQTAGRSLEGSFTEALNYGFTPAIRHAFLSQAHVDPIDLAPPYLYFDSDLRQPFFLDDNLRGSSSIYDGRDEPVPGFEDLLPKWQKFRADMNRAEVTRLLNGVAPALPILVDVSQKYANPAIPQMQLLTPWKPGDVLPEFDRPNTFARETGPGDKVLFPVRRSPNAYEESSIRSVLFQMTKPEFKYEIALDFTSAPEDQLLKALAKWFKPMQAP